MVAEEIGFTTSTSTRLALEELPPNNPVRRFGDLYLAHRDENGVLLRSAFDPTEQPKLLPWLQLFEFSPPDEFYCRLMGTAVVRLFNRDYTGKYLREYMTAPAIEDRLYEMTECLKTGSPSFFFSHSAVPGREHIRIVRGLFPALGKNGQMLFYPIAPWHAEIP